jgi:cathepsin A (carboxypeptidase C)
MTSTNDMYIFLKLWFKAFEKTQNAFYIAGESFGGTWVPLLAEKITQQQSSAIAQVAQPYIQSPVHIPLNGILLGNAGLSQKLALNGYYEIGCATDPPLFPEVVCGDMMLAEPKCDKWIAACSLSGHDRRVCNTLLDECRSYNMFQIFQAKLNPYDFRMPCEDVSNCYPEEKDAEAYLNRKDIQEELGVKKPFKSCNNTVNQAFVNQGELGRPSDHVVGWLLDHGLRVLIYVGKADWYCNFPGQRRVADSIAWHGAAGFRANKLEDWTYGGAVAGKRKSWGGLTYVDVEGAGHMSPKDKPAEIEQILLEWLTGGNEQ